MPSEWWFQIVMSTWLICRISNDRRVAIFFLSTIWERDHCCVIAIFVKDVLWFLLLFCFHLDSLLFCFTTFWTFKCASLLWDLFFLQNRLIMIQFRLGEQSFAWVPWLLIFFIHCFRWISISTQLSLLSQVLLHVCTNFCTIFINFICCVFWIIRISVCFSLCSSVNEVICHGIPDARYVF